MPDHGWKFSLVLGTLAASIVICASASSNSGPTWRAASRWFTSWPMPTRRSIGHAGDAGERSRPMPETQIRSGGREFQLADLIAALKQRLDPDGTKEITIREYGPAVEIIIPQTGQDELEFVKRRITDLGQLEFRITADPTRPKDRPIIEQAKRLAAQPEGGHDRRQQGRRVGGL